MNNKENIKVIFLDIDGVLQPYNSRGRFEYEREKGLVNLRDELSDKFGVDYTQYHPYDVGACYLDWDVDAVNNIKRILEETNAKIVVSSDWRDKEKSYKVRDFLKLWDMDKYWLADNVYYNKDLMKDETEYLKSILEPGNTWGISHRVAEILYYVANNDNIVNYVAIDDANLNSIPKGHYVETNNLIKKEEADLVIEYLNAISNRDEILSFVKKNK